MLTEKQLARRFEGNIDRYVKKRVGVIKSANRRALGVFKRGFI